MSGGVVDPAILGEQWTRLKQQLCDEFGEAIFNSWLKPLRFVALQDGQAQIAAPTRFMRDWVRGHYAERIRELWFGANPAVKAVNLYVGTKKTAALAESGGAITGGDAKSNQDSVGPASAATVNFAAFDDMNEFGAPLDPRFTFDAFVIGRSNELGYAAARRVAENTGVAFNPLFLYGGVGLGKTHLMHAIAHHIRQSNPRRKVMYMSAEKFMYQFIRALRHKDTIAFKQQFRTVDVLMIDDVQFIGHKNSTQEEFFHTFNALVDHHRQVVVSADRSPSDLEGIEERIRSRLGWGLVADIHPTDYELRLGILHSKAERLGEVDIPNQVLEFLARRVTSNIRELEGALNRVVAFSTLVGRPVTAEMTQEVLQDLLRANDRRVTIEEIQRKVAEYFDLRLADMLSPRRARAVARPRQIAMYLAKQMTARSLPEIGRKFGGRDHTTVMHAVKRIDELRRLDSGIDEAVAHLSRLLEI